MQLITGAATGNIKDIGDDGEALKQTPLILSMDSVSGSYVAQKASGTFDAAPSDSIAVIPVVGPIMKNDSCGDPGTMTMAAWVDAAAANPKISAIILKIDSPGGTVSGTQTLSDAIDAAKKQKPVISFIEEGMMASAAYWIGSRANEIIASQATDYVGSIGVYSTMYDLTPYYESLGVKMEDVYSSLSSQKNEDYRAFRATGKVPETMIAALDFIANKFIGAVKDARGERINISAGDPFKGRLFNAEAAVKNGLIDSIGNIHHAATRAMDLKQSYAAAASTTTTTNDNMKITFKSAWAAVLAFCGVEVASAEQTEITPDHIEKLNAGLLAKDEKIAELDGTITSLNSTVADLNTQIASLTAKNTELQSTIDTYGSKPGAASTSPAATADVIDTDENQRAIDELPHNKAADEYIIAK